MLEEKRWTLNMVLLTYHLRHMTKKNGIKNPDNPDLRSPTTRR